MTAERGNVRQYLGRRSIDTISAPLNQQRKPQRRTASNEVLAMAGACDRYSTVCIRSRTNDWRITNPT
jgi:hypothetical protein